MPWHNIIVLSGSSLLQLDYEALEKLNETVTPVHPGSWSGAGVGVQKTLEYLDSCFARNDGEELLHEARNVYFPTLGKGQMQFCFHSGAVVFSAEGPPILADVRIPGAGADGYQEVLAVLWP